MAFAQTLLAKAAGHKADAATFYGRTGSGAGGGSVERKASMGQSEDDVRAKVWLLVKSPDSCGGWLWAARGARARVQLQPSMIPAQPSSPSAPPAPPALPPVHPCLPQVRQGIQQALQMVAGEAAGSEGGALPDAGPVAEAVEGALYALFGELAGLVLEPSGGERVQQGRQQR